MLQLSFNPFPEIRTERLLLRQIQDSDVEDMFFLRSDARVLQYINKEPATELSHARAHIQSIREFERKGDAITWGISLKGDPAMIGTICLWNIIKEHHRAEIGYVLHPGHHRKGMMKEAIAPVIDYGFRVMNLHSIFAQVNPFNEGSIRLLEINGFVKEGHFKEDFYYDGEFMDTAVYSLLTPL